MNTLAHPAQRGLLPDLLDWLESPLTAMRPQGPGMRLEEFIRDGRYVLRAELPGIDPENDVDVSITGRELTIHGERSEEHREEYRTEFRYGSFTRTVTLPPSADENDIRATYETGILEVSVGIREPAEGAKHIEVQKKD